MTIRSIKKQNLFDVCNIAKRKLRQKKKRKRQKKKTTQMTLQQLFQNIVDREIVRTQKFYEFRHFLKQIRSEISKICTAVNITNILSFAKFIVSEFTSSQRSSFEIRINYESSIMSRA